VVLGLKWIGVYFRKLPFETNNARLKSVLEELRVRKLADIQEEICYLLQSSLEVGGTPVKVARMKLEWEKNSVFFKGNKLNI